MLKYLVLVVAVLAGCNGPNDVVTEPTCDEILDECVSMCPENQAPGATAKESCEASCQAEHGLCVVPVPLECKPVDFSGFCDNTMCQRDSVCNRNPNGAFGPEVTCVPKSDNVWTCKWSSVPATTK